MFDPATVLPVLAQAELVIDWENLPTYNTIMSLAAGAGLILLVRLARDLLVDPSKTSADGYALSFGVLGTILVTTGLHMTLTWPLAPDFAFDNIVFGEPALLFGTLLLAVAVYAWRRGSTLVDSTDTVERIAAIAKPMSPLILGAGLSLIAIAAAGMSNQLFTAPPQEPISGWVAGLHPWLEPTFISGLYALTGLGALATPSAIAGNARARTTAGWSLTVTGWTFLLFGAFNYFSHIGLVVNTM